MTIFPIIIHKCGKQNIIQKHFSTKHEGEKKEKNIRKYQKLF